MQAILSWAILIYWAWVWRLRWSASSILSRILRIWDAWAWRKTTNPWPRQELVLSAARCSRLMFDTDRHMLPHYIVGKTKFQQFLTCGEDGGGWGGGGGDKASQEGADLLQPSLCPRPHFTGSYSFLLIPNNMCVRHVRSYSFLFIPNICMWPRHVGKCARVVSVRRIHSQNAQTASQAIAQLNAGFQ